jgi:hypothetical protein
MLRKIIKPALNLAETFVHRNAWYSISDFVYSSDKDQWAPEMSNSTPCGIDDIFDGAVLFITPWGITEFVEKIHPQIKNSYSIVSWCYGPTYGIKDCINDPKIISWFGNANSEAITFDKFTLIPVGIFATDEIFHKRNEVFEYIQKYNKNVKDNLLYMNFTVHEGQHVSFANRRKVFDTFRDKSYCKMVVLTDTWRMPFREYMEEMSHYKFVVSPPGDQHEAYRHWEALIVGSIPVMRRTSLDGIFNDLPAIFVDDYTEITEDFLHKKYEELKDQKYNYDKLYMKYWVDKISKI